MKRFVLAVLFSSLAASARAESGALEKFTTFFKNWKMGLERSAVEGRQKKAKTTAVAAVRGAGQADNPELPYWKGSLSSKKEAELLKEREELGTAVEAVLSGDLKKGSNLLDVFEASHPGSSLLPDLKEGRKMLDEMKQQQAADAAAPKDAPAAKPEAEEDEE